MIYIYIYVCISSGISRTEDTVVQSPEGSFCFPKMASGEALEIWLEHGNEVNTQNAGGPPEGGWFSPIS